jgi:hypothetical protein
MANSIYGINKGINKPIEFKGLKAQYIGYLAGGLVGLLVLFAILYIAGVNTYVCVVLILFLGSMLFAFMYRLSDRYGEHGIMKKLARRNIPTVIKNRTRKVFYCKEK